MASICASFDKIKHTVAYIDTVELALFRPDAPHAADQFQMQPIHHWRTRDLIGWRIIASPAWSWRELLALNDFQRAHDARLHRVHLAADFFTMSGDTEPLREYLHNSVVIPWRKKGPMFAGDEDDQQGCSTWACHGNRRPNRNLALYDDKPCRLPGYEQEYPVHLELRFERSDPCKRQGWRTVHDLLNTDPNEIFARNIRLATNVTEVFEDAGNRLARISVSEDREAWIRQGRPEQHPVADRLRAHLSRRVRGLLKRLHYDRAQVLRDTEDGHRLIRLVRPDLLHIPHELNWHESLNEELNETLRSIPTPPCPRTPCFV